MSYGYVPVPGSAALPTVPRPEIPLIDDDEAVIRSIGGHWIFPVRVKGRAVPILDEVFDDLAPLQSPLEQIVYLHLYRLAIGAGRNACRVSNADLARRARLSPIRLKKAVAGLVAKGHVVLLHRDCGGTLYRVVFPHELFDRGDAGAIEVPAAAPDPLAAASCAAPPPPVVEPPEGRPLRAKRGWDFDSLSRSRTPAELADRYVLVYGERPGRTRAEVLAEAERLIAAGQTIYELAFFIIEFAETVPRTTPIAAFGDFIDAWSRRFSTEEG